MVRPLSKFYFLLLKINDKNQKHEVRMECDVLL